MNIVTDVLDPDSRNGVSFRLNRGLLVRWFVDYNPLFTLSALCVLGGVLVLANALRAAEGASVSLTGVLELYQWVLIGMTALLYRRLNEHRPGVILGVIALVFLVDPTLQLSALATDDHPVLSAVWVLGVALKLEALAWALCLRMSISTRVLAVLGAALVAFLPNASLVEDLGRMAPFALATGLFALGVFATLLPPSVRSTRALGNVGTIMLPRLLKAAVGIALGGGLLQGINALLAVGLGSMTMALSAVALIVAINCRRNHEFSLWLAVGVAFLMSMSTRVFADIGMPMIAVALFVAARHHAPRVLSAALVASAVPSVVAALDLFSAARAITFAAGVHIGLLVVVTIGLMAVLVKQRAPSALLGLALVHFKTVQLLVLPSLVLPAASSVGVGLVGLGFVLLPLGVMAHRRFSAVVSRLDAQAAFAAEGPCSSAAPGL